MHEVMFINTLSYYGKRICHCIDLTKSKLNYDMIYFDLKDVTCRKTTR